MKRFLIFMLCCLPGLFVQAANHWTGPSSSDYPTSSMLHIQLTVEGVSSAPSVELAAFVGGTCRAVATVRSATTGFYDLRVWGGDADVGQPITIMAFYNKLEYVFATTYAFTGETIMPIPLPLTLNPLIGVSVENPINITKTTPFTDFDLSPYITLLYGGSSTESSVASPLTYVWSGIAPGSGFTITDNKLSAPHEGGSPATLTVKGPNYGSSVANIQFVTAAVETEIIVANPTVDVTSVTCTIDPAYFEVSVGDNVYSAITPYITVLPDEATNKGLYLEAIVDPGVPSPFTTGGIAVTPGTYTVIVSSQSNPEVNCQVTPKILRPVSFTIPANIELSRLHPVEVNFTGLVGDNFDKSKIAVVFSDAYTGQPCATAVMADDTGMKWSFQGLYSGQYSYSVTYDGEGQQTTVGGIDASVSIPAEVAFGNGWDWISLFAITETTTGYDLTDGTGNYLPQFSVDNNNRIIEMRSQEQWLYNDPDIGFFGDITLLTPEDGMYKVKSQYASADSRVINLGTMLTRANSLTLPQVRKGYTWICYPNEFDMDLTAINALPWPHAVDGDQIKGKTSFIEYRAGQWEGTGSFRLEAGKGYMYYTTGDGGYTLDFDTSAPAPALSLSQARAAKLSVWHFDASQWADNMAVVAKLADARRYSIGAFVGDECRGMGEAVTDDLAFINVAGCAGETVTFRLYDTITGAYIPLDGSLRWSQKAGSIDAPVPFGTVTGIDTVSCSQFTDHHDIYDLQGRRIANVPLQKGLYIVNGKLRIKQ